MILSSLISLTIISIVSTYFSQQLRSWLIRRRWKKALAKNEPILASKDSQKEASLRKLTKNIEHLIARLPHGRKVTQWIADSGSAVGLTVGNLVLVTLGLQILAVNLASLLNLSVLGMMLVSLLMELGIVFWVLKKGANSDLLEREFPLVLESIARVYRLHPDLKESSLRAIARIQDPRLKRVFSHTVQLSSGGMTTVEALEYSSRDISYSPLHFMTSVIKSRLKLGGNIPLFLEEMANSLKVRRETERQIASTLFQNKISALIVSVLVPIIFIFSFLFSSQYRSIVTEDSFARFVIVAAFIWWAIGVVFISRVVRTRM